MENKMLIEKAIAFIQNNPKERLSLQSIADNAGFSLTYFDAIFKKHTGYSPVEYSRIYKLTRSALALRKTENTILDIALEFGYSNPESYTRVFKSFYGITPSEYRAKYAGIPLTVRDYSGKVAIGHFKRSHPELRSVNKDTALDYLFTHNPVLHAEDIVGMTVADAEVLTLSDTEEPEGFLYVADYNAPIPSGSLVCSTEIDAMQYLELLSKNETFSFSVRIPPEEEWNAFQTEAAKHGMTCRRSYDMAYLENAIEVPNNPSMEVRELNAEDMSLVRKFRQRGGCADCHVRGLQAHFDHKGNEGERAFGLFYNGDLVCLATPVLDSVREMKKYDIGALFAIGQGNTPEAIEYIWKYVIDACMKSGAVLGNASATEGDDLLSVAASEGVGMIKVAKVCRYSKKAPQ